MILGHLRLYSVLTPYATEFRYPDDYLSEPTVDMVQEAILYAEKILNFVKQRIFEFESGQTNIFK
ncbi:HEPN domain-containing protein [Candidatus Babeliales bacterium]|nr:HEPN domain-containing protein [Candidatus Babeliales bacterium]MCF7899204.1 HEPN domain-containing protein [Candidatus Babeliales bacterium]